MSNKAWRVEGDFQMGRVRQHFGIEIVAADEEGARMGAFAELGSRHGVKRREVSLQSVTPLKTEDAHPITQHRLKE